MERSPEIDLEDWELLPDDGFFYYKHGDRKRSSAPGNSGSVPKGSVDVNYHLKSSHQLIELPANSTCLNASNDLKSQVAFVVEKNPDRELVEEIERVPIVEINLSPAIVGKLKDPNLADPDAVSQIFFKKMKETQFVDMKMDTQESGNKGIKPQMGLGSLLFEEKGEVCNGEELVQSPTKQVIEQKKGDILVDIENKEKGSWEGGGFSIWRWRLTGRIGALCSLGVAAATICIIIFGRQNQKPQNQNQNQKLKFQIYAEDKRIEQVVQHATRLNQALSAVRGVPLPRANITFGGYCDGP